VNLLIKYCTLLVLLYVGSFIIPLNAASKINFSDSERQFLSSMDSIKLCVGPDSIPLDTIENGNHVGVNAEFMAIFESLIQVPIELVTTNSWNESIDKVKSSSCDIISLIQETPNRRNFLFFTDTYVEIPFVVITTQEKFFPTNLAEIIDKPLGIRAGFAYVELLRARYPGIDLTEVNTIEEGFNLVNSGRLFGYLTGFQIAGYAIQEGGRGNLKISGQFDELTNIKLGIGINKSKPFLVDIFNKAIASISASEKKRINNSWLVLKYEIGEDYQKVYQITAAAIVIVLFLLYRQRNLREHNRQLEVREKEIWQEAKFDFLTGLPNRRFFQEKIESEIVNSLADDGSFSLLLIDLDGFKEVNDTLGHDQGDELLIEASQRINSCLPENSILARLGGDEFVVILRNINEPKIIARVAQNILNAVKAPFQLRQQAFVSASIGITVCPEDSSTMVELMKNADQAMYAAKERGRNVFHRFTPQMRKDAVARMNLIGDLRKAIEREEFEVFYQPIIDLESLKVKKCEALIRWNHPEKGFISPVVFIPILEDTQMIIEVGEQVFKQSAKQVKIWRQTIDPEFEISVNTSPVQFENRSTIGWSNYLKELQLDISAIGIEMTESMLMEGYHDITSHLSELRDSGFQISLDDFGTGYSSLSYLKKFDIDYLKIDKSFVNNLKAGSSDMVLCEAIIVMAHKLGLKVIAEGVETHDQQVLLKQAGCDYGQGFLFSKPVSSQDFMNIPVVAENL
jgi:diguanylate cyclase (GGDEF)-like protein